MINVSIIGANGYTGLELMQLLSTRQDVCLQKLVSKSNSGTPITKMYPNLVPLYGRNFDELNIEEIAKCSDVVFSCLPHSASSEICSKLFHMGVKVIDLSADFRYKNLTTYEEWYKVKHYDSELNAKAVYGLTEIYREQIKNSSIIGNPGCYTTSAILPLYPLLSEKVIDGKSIIVDSKSGTSGAGKKETLTSLYCEVDESFKAYSVASHRHTSEIEEQLSFAAGKEITLDFTPHLLPIKRGILSTIYVDLIKDIGAVKNAYEKFYGNSFFVKVLPSEELPEIKHVAGSNYCFIGYKLNKRTNKLIIVSTIDNLIKGASGQAIQNMNVMFGLPEETGLMSPAKYL